MEMSSKNEIEKHNLQKELDHMKQIEELQRKIRKIEEERSIQEMKVDQDNKLKMREMEATMRKDIIVQEQKIY